MIYTVFSITLPEYLERGGKLEKLDVKDMSYCGGEPKYINAGNICSIELNGRVNPDGDSLYQVEFQRNIAPSMHGDWIKVRVDFQLADRYFDSTEKNADNC